MPDTKHIARIAVHPSASRLILRYYCSAKIPAAAFCLLCLAASFALLRVLILSGSLWLIGVYFGILFGGLLGMVWLSSRLSRRFARRLSVEEQEVLRNAAVDGTLNQKWIAEEILNLNAKVVPDKEYVRASAPPEQPDTLLRAAQPSADTAQEQLLRPTQE